MLLAYLAMSNKSDSSTFISSEAKNNAVVVIHVDDLSGKEEPVNKDISPSIKSASVDHISVPTRTVDGNNHSGNNSIAQSTAELDVDDGVDKTTKKISTETYKKIWENVCLGILIVVICGTFLTPVVIFYTRPNFENPFSFDKMQSSSCQEVSSQLNICISSCINNYDI